MTTTNEMVVLETMPDYLRGSHRDAGNWGAYPRNGAERRIVSRAEAEQIVAQDPDGYAQIIEVAQADEAEQHEPKVRHYRAQDGVGSYDAGDILVCDDTGERHRAVRTGHGIQLERI